MRSHSPDDQVARRQVHVRAGPHTQARQHLLHIGGDAGEVHGRPLVAVAGEVEDEFVGEEGGAEEGVVAVCVDFEGSDAAEEGAEGELQGCGHEVWCFGAWSVGVEGVAEGFQVLA